MKIINLHDIEQEALARKKSGASIMLDPDSMLRILAALREADSRAASGIGYIQWHGIIDVKDEPALRGVNG